jgi:hypothetical protein
MAVDAETFSPRPTGQLNASPTITSRTRVVEMLSNPKAQTRATMILARGAEYALTESALSDVNYFFWSGVLIVAHQRPPFQAEPAQNR